MTLLWICIGIIAQYVIGCAVMASFDRQEEWFAWAERCPFGFAFIPLTWPVWLYLYLRNK